jgi:hypothetical protein
MNRAEGTTQKIAGGEGVNLIGAAPLGDSTLAAALRYPPPGWRVVLLHHQVAEGQCTCQPWRDSVQRLGHWASVKRLPGELFNPWRNACGFYPQDVLGRQRKLLDAAANLKMVNAGQNRVMQ